MFTQLFICFVVHPYAGAATGTERWHPSHCRESVSQVVYRRRWYPHTLMYSLIPSISHLVVLSITRSISHSMSHLVIHCNLPSTTQLTIPLLSAPVQMPHVVSCTLLEEHPTDHSIILDWRDHTSGRGPS